MTTVTRTNVPIFSRIRWGLAFPDGTADVVVAVEYKADCGCVIEFGLRNDKPDPGERAQLCFACPVHRPVWPGVLAMMAALDMPTEEAFRLALEEVTPQ